MATECKYVADIERFFIRILPTSVKGDESRRGRFGVPHRPMPDGDPNHAVVFVGNRGNLPIAAKDLLDPGFLELVRYGIRKPGDPLIVDSLRTIDSPQAKIRIEFAQDPRKSGPGWHRYNEDGYGNYANGDPFNGSGRGGTWPLLTGERGHYDLAAGRNPKPNIEAMEHFADATGLIPEQLWDLPDNPDAHMKFGYPSGGAMPLAWAHAEYIKLVRSAADHKSLCEK